MKYQVHINKHNALRMGPGVDPRFSTEVEASSPKEAKALARKEWEATRTTTPAGIDPSWQYCIPPAGTLIPYTRMVARVMGTTYYVGSACKRHPLNHVRYTISRECVICKAMEGKIGSIANL